MRTTLSSKGQIILNAPLRRAMGLEPGTTFTITRKGNQIILEPEHIPPPKGEIVRADPAGYSALEPAPKTPKLTNERVEELLADFP